jgi:hypothetical protein
MQDESLDRLCFPASTAAQEFPLVFKLALASASTFAYAALTQLVPMMEAFDDSPITNDWFHLVAGAVFGALVLGPYAVPERRWPRAAGLSAAGAVIYYLAVWFVVSGPSRLDATGAFVLAGAGAALLSGAAVVAIAPRAASGRLFLLLVLAGAAGGAAFTLNFAFDEILYVGHAAWQLLVCLALHFGMRAVSASSAS